MLPSCFKNPTTTNRHHNLTTSTYQTTLGLFTSPTLLTLTWSKTHTSHTLTLHSPLLFTSTISLSPSPLSLFRTRPRSKSIPLNYTHIPDSPKNKLRLHWDFTRAEFDRVNAAEPISSFYLAITVNGRTGFFLGDVKEELTPTESTHVSRRVHVFGRRSYSASWLGSNSRHEVEIECCGGAMRVKIDGKTELVVKRLAWKFRGSERVSIGGLEIEFLWDVFNWVSGEENGGNGGHGVFVFQVGGGGGPLPEMVGPEKRMMRKFSSASGVAATAGGVVSPAPSWSSSVLQWAEESGDHCGRSSGLEERSLGSFGGGGGGGGGGFSLIIYAWRRRE